MKIPDYMDCKSKIYIECDYFMSVDCLETCNFSQRIRKGISHKSKTGLERFVLRYGENWRMVID